MTPLAVVHITQRCNQRCVFCLEGELVRKGATDPSMDEVCQTLGLLRADGADRIIFMGGETLLRPDFVEIVRAARQLGFAHVMVATNGTPLGRPGYARKLVEAGLDRVELSIEADTPELASAISGVSFTLERQLAALDAIDELGLATTVNLVVCRENRERITSILGFIRERVGRAPLDVKIKFVSLQGRALDAARQDGSGLRYGDVDIDALVQTADALGLPLSFYDFPLCRLGSHCTRSLELENLCREQTYLDREPTTGRYFDSGYQLSRKAWPSAPCQGCTLLPICPGVDTAQLELHGASDLSASQEDPVLVTARALVAFGFDPSRAEAIVSAARRLARPNASRDCDRRPDALRFARDGEARDIGLQIVERREGEKAYARSARFALSYTTGEEPSAFELPGVDRLLASAARAMKRADAAGACLAEAREAVGAVMEAGWHLVR